MIRSDKNDTALLQRLKAMPEHSEPKYANHIKPTFVFYFADAPHFVAKESRAWVSNALRAYRKQSTRYQLKRTGLHAYTVKVRHGSMLGNTLGVIVARDA